MNIELDQNLVKSFPNLYRDRYGDMRSTCMVWGFPGNGWYDILWDLSKKLEKMIVKIKKDNPPPKYLKFKTKWNKIVYKIFQPIFRIPKLDWFLFDLGMEYPCASQVKEKFGTLRFYMTSYTKQMDKAIGEAERKSAITCELCGKKGKLNKEGWITCLCTKCRKAQK